MVKLNIDRPIITLETIKIMKKVRRQLTGLKKIKALESVESGGGFSVSVIGLQSQPPYVTGGITFKKNPKYRRMTIVFK